MTCWGGSRNGKDGSKPSRKPETRTRQQLHSRRIRPPHVYAMSVRRCQTSRTQRCYSRTGPASPSAVSVRVAFSRYARSSSSSHSRNSWISGLTPPYRCMAPPIMAYCTIGLHHAQYPHRDARLIRKDRASFQRETAIDNQMLASDELGLVRRKEYDSIRDILRLGKAAQIGPFQHGLLYSLGHSLE